MPDPDVSMDRSAFIFRWCAASRYKVSMQFRELSTPLHSVTPKKTRILNIITVGKRNVISQLLTVESNTMEYTECHRRNGPNFGRVFLMLNYTDITQNTYIQS